MQAPPVHSLPGLAATAARAAASLGAAPPLAAGAVQRALLHYGAEAADAAHAGVACFVTTSLTCDPQRVERTVFDAVQLTGGRQQSDHPPEVSGHEPPATPSRREARHHSRSPDLFQLTFVSEGRSRRSRGPRTPPARHLPSAGDGTFAGRPLGSNTTAKHCRSTAETEQRSCPQLVPGLLSTAQGNFGAPASAKCGACPAASATPEIGDRLTPEALDAATQFCLARLEGRC